MVNDTKHKLVQALRLLADVLETESSEPAVVVWIDQTTSPLGRRRHCATVRRRLEQGLPGAVVVGRAHRLTREALDEELTAVSRAHVPTRVETESPTVVDELQRELRLVGGKR